MVLMEALNHQRTIVILILLNQTQNVVRMYIIMLLIVTSLLMEKKSLSLKLTIKMTTLQLNFVSKVLLMVNNTEFLRSTFKWKCV